MVDPEWTWVPGHGMVRWTATRLDEHARHLAGSHRPSADPDRVTPFRRLRLPRLRPLRCKVCHVRWRCAPAAWATSRLAGRADP